MIIALAKAQSSPRKGLIVKKDEITRTANRLEQKY